MASLRVRRNAYTAHALTHVPTSTINIYLYVSFDTVNDRVAHHHTPTAKNKILSHDAYAAHV